MFLHKSRTTIHPWRMIKLSRSLASLRKFDKRGFRFMRDKIIIDKMTKA